MHNFFTIEIEAEARRHEFERAAAADARSARASRVSRSWGWAPRFSRPAATTSARSLPAMPVGALVELQRVPRPVAS